MLHLLQMGPFEILTTFFFQIENSMQLSLLELPCLLLLGDPTPTKTVIPSSNSSSLYTSAVLFGLLSANAAPRPTLAFKPLNLLPSTSYLVLLYRHHRFMFLAVFLYRLLPLPSGFFNEMLEISEARSTKLLHFVSFHPVDHICIQVSNLNSSFSFPISGFSAMRSDRTHSRSGILSPDSTHTSNGIIIFVRQGLSFFELSTSLFLRLILTLIM